MMSATGAGGAPTSRRRVVRSTTSPSIAHHEWDVLCTLALCDGKAASDALRRIDWGMLLIGALVHRLGPLLAVVLATEEVETPWGMREPLEMVLQGNRRRASVYTEEAVRVCQLLSGRAVPVAVTKGTALHHSLFATDGTRWFGDIDMMIYPSHANAVEAALGEAGYSIGAPGRGGTVRALSRSEQLAYAFSPDHLRRRAMSYDDPVVPVVNIDVAYSLTWASAEWQIPMGDVMGSVENISAGPHVLPVLGRPFHYVFVVLHAFRESWFERSRGPNLAQVRDIVRMTDSLDGRDEETVRTIIGAYDLHFPMGWILRNLDEAFGLHLGDRFRLPPGNEDWLLSASAAGGRPARWSAPLVERLRDGRWEIDHSGKRIGRQ